MKSCITLKEITYLSDQNLKFLDLKVLLKVEDMEKILGVTSV